MTLTQTERKEKLGHGAATRIATKTGRTIGHVAQVLRGERHDRKVEAAAARTLQMKIEDAFPEYYGEQSGHEHQRS